jgi:hypothetical protein
MNNLKILSLMFWILLSYSNPIESNANILKRVESFMKDPNFDHSKIRKILESGLMDGFFSADEIKLIFSHLSSEYSEYVSSKIIGQSVQNRDISAFYLSNAKHSKGENIRSKVLFTGAHHAREVITTNMIVKIFLETLHSLIYGHGKVNFWNYCDLIIVPIVNIDSYAYISESFGTDDWSSHSMKRKNMNSDYCA